MGDNRTARTGCNRGQSHSRGLRLGVGAGSGASGTEVLLFLFRQPKAALASREGSHTASQQRPVIPKTQRVHQPQPTQPHAQVHTTCPRKRQVPQSKYMHVDRGWGWDGGGVSVSVPPTMCANTSQPSQMMRGLASSLEPYSKHTVHRSESWALYGLLVGLILDRAQDSSRSPDARGTGWGACVSKRAQTCPTP